MNVSKQVSDIAWNSVGENVVVLELRTERKFHELNETASFLWKKMQGDLNEKELVESLALEYDVTQQQAKLDVQDFISELERLNLIGSES